MEGSQRTKSSSWKEDADDEDKVASIVKVFTWCASQYHAKFADTDGYDASYTAHLDPHKTYCY